MGRKRKIEEVEDIKNEDVETVDTPVVEQAIELAVEAEKVEEKVEEPVIEEKVEIAKELKKEVAKPKFEGLDSFLM